MNELLASISLFLFGGITFIHTIFFFLLFGDWMMKLAADFICGEFDASKVWTRLLKKIMVILIVTSAHMVDVILETENDIFQYASLFFYVINDMFSILQHANRVGLPLPDFLVTLARWFRNKD